MAEPQTPDKAEQAEQLAVWPMNEDGTIKRFCLFCGDVILQAGVMAPTKFTGLVHKRCLYRSG